MGLEPYRRVLAVPGFSSVIPLGLLAKLPVTAIPITLTLHTVLGLGRGYAEAGLATAGWVAGVGIGSPVQGRFIERYGLRRLLCASLLAQAAFWGAAPMMSFALFAAGAAASGLLLVPGSTVVRLAIASLVPEDRRRAAFALDSMVTEVSYMSGPPLAVLVATRLGTDTALLSLGAVLAVSSGALIVRNPPSGSADASRRAAGSVGVRAIRNPRLLAVLACTVAAASVVSGYEVGVVGTLRSLGEVERSGLVLLACGAYSLLGGLLFGTLQRAFALPALIGLLGLATLPLGFAGNWLVLALCIAPAASLCAPAFAATADAASKVAGAGATAMGLYTAALTVGTALGAVIVGAALDAGGSRAGFAVAGGVGLGIAAAAWPQLRTSARHDSSDSIDPPTPTVVR